MSEGGKVDASGGAPTLMLDDYATATDDAAASNLFAGQLVFDYTVIANDYAANLKILGFNADGATIVDAHAVAAVAAAPTTARSPSAKLSPSQRP
jgi:hypothetical protein